MELKEITIDNINMSPAYIFHIKSLDYIYIGRITGISNNKITIDRKSTRLNSSH